MTEHDRTEEHLADALADLVEGQHPSPDLRDRVAAGIGSRTHTTPRLLPAAAAAVVVVVALLAALVTAGSGDEETGVATAPDGPVTTVPEPEVLGDRIERDPGEAPEPAPTTTTAPPTTEPAPPTTAAVIPPPPTTTTTICRNSTDPACGPFRWDPAPANQPAKLTITPPAGTIREGDLVVFELTMSDPDGPVGFSCYAVSVDRPDATSTGGCQTVREPECPARYGPWTPPAPHGESETSTSAVEFQGTGTYTVDVLVQPADGCDNVDPYRSGAQATITVEVQPAS